MLKPILLGLAAAALSLPASAQMAGPRDGTDNIKSESIGTPGQPTDAATQYLQQKSLNNLPGERVDRATRDKLGPSRPAKLAELTTGAIVNDKTGLLIAKIEQVDPDGIVVSTGVAKVKIPAGAFGHNKAGLLLDMTKVDFDKVVAQAK